MSGWYLPFEITPFLPCSFERFTSPMAHSYSVKIFFYCPARSSIDRPRIVLLDVSGEISNGIIALGLAQHPTRESRESHRRGLNCHIKTGVETSRATLHGDVTGTERRNDELSISDVFPNAQNGHFACDPLNPTSDAFVIPALRSMFPTIASERLVDAPSVLTIGLDPCDELGHNCSPGEFLGICLFRWGKAHPGHVHVSLGQASVDHCRLSQFPGSGSDEPFTAPLSRQDQSSDARRQALVVRMVGHAPSLRRTGFLAAAPEQRIPRDHTLRGARGNSPNTCQPSLHCRPSARTSRCPWRRSWTPGRDRAIRPAERGGLCRRPQKATARATARAARCPQSRCHRGRHPTRQRDFQGAHHRPSLSSPRYRQRSP